MGCPALPYFQNTVTGNCAEVSERKLLERSEELSGQSAKHLQAQAGSLLPTWVNLGTQLASREHHEDLPESDSTYRK